MPDAPSPSPPREPSRPPSGPTFRALVRVAFRSELRRGPVRVALVFAALSIFSFAVLGAVLARGGRPFVAPGLGFAAEAIAWGPGVLVAFAGGLRGWLIDRETGLSGLALSRGVAPARFALARIAAAFALILLTAGGGTVCVALAALVASPNAPHRASLVAHGAGGLALCVALAAVLAPLSLATLGPRARGAGYGLFVLCLAGPEAVRVAARISSGGDADGVDWTTLGSIPAALRALRVSLAPATFDAGLAAAAVVVVAAVAALATWVAVMSARRLSEGALRGP